MQYHDRKQTLANQRGAELRVIQQCFMHCYSPMHHLEHTKQYAVAICYEHAFQMMVLRRGLLSRLAIQEVLQHEAIPQTGYGNESASG